MARISAQIFAVAPLFAMLILGPVGVILAGIGLQRREWGAGYFLIFYLLGLLPLVI